MSDVREGTWDGESRSFPELSKEGGQLSKGSGSIPREAGPGQVWSEQPWRAPPCGTGTQRQLRGPAMKNQEPTESSAGICVDTWCQVLRAST